MKHTDEPQWDDSKNAGFSSGTPWMRVHDDYKTWNVAAQTKDPESVLTFWTKMLRIRKEYEALIYGEHTRKSRRRLPLNQSKLRDPHPA